MNYNINDDLSDFLKNGEGERNSNHTALLKMYIIAVNDLDSKAIFDVTNVMEDLILDYK